MDFFTKGGSILSLIEKHFLSCSKQSEIAPSTTIIFIEKANAYIDSFKEYEFYPYLREIFLAEASLSMMTRCFTTAQIIKPDFFEKPTDKDDEVIDYSLRLAPTPFWCVIECKYDLDALQEYVYSRQSDTLLHPPKAEKHSYIALAKNEREGRLLEIEPKHLELIEMIRGMKTPMLVSELVTVLSEIISNEEIQKFLLCLKERKLIYLQVEFTEADLELLPANFYQNDNIEVNYNLG
jgi:hypothetical protein